MALRQLVEAAFFLPFFIVEFVFQGELSKNTEGEVCLTS